LLSSYQQKRRLEINKIETPVCSILVTGRSKDKIPGLAVSETAVGGSVWAGPSPQMHSAFVTGSWRDTSCLLLERQ